MANKQKALLVVIGFVALGLLFYVRVNRSRSDVRRSTPKKEPAMVSTPEQAAETVTPGTRALPAQSDDLAPTPVASDNNYPLPQPIEPNLVEPLATPGPSSVLPAPTPS